MRTSRESLKLAPVTDSEDWRELFERLRAQRETLLEQIAEATKLLAETEEQIADIEDYVIGCETEKQVCELEEEQ